MMNKARKAQNLAKSKKNIYEYLITNLHESVMLVFCA